MNLDLEGGKSEKIKIYYDSKPEELAFEFCKSNNLNFEIMNYLKDEITKVLSENSSQSSSNSNNKQGNINILHEE
jgi:hypothetical protein